MQGGNIMDYEYYSTDPYNPPEPTTAEINGDVISIPDRMEIARLFRHLKRYAKAPEKEVIRATNEWIAIAHELRREQK